MGATSTPIIIIAITIDKETKKSITDSKKLYKFFLIEFKAYALANINVAVDNK